LVISRFPRALGPNRELNDTLGQSFAIHVQLTGGADDLHATLTLPPAAIDITANGSLRRWYWRRMRAHHVPTGAIPIPI
jgi:hypothetical protein